MPQRLFDIMSGQDRSLAAHAARFGLSCLSPCYRGAVAARNAMFDWGLRKPKELPRPVISIGNITTGGTGKTPMVIHLADRLVDMGHKPAVLLRGYMAPAPAGERVVSSQGGTAPSTGEGAREGGDEFSVYERDLPPYAKVFASRRRFAAGDFALRTDDDISVFLLDDGFQHRQLHRDLDIVLIDATAPFGFGRLLPRGMLREPLSRLRRADAVIVTRAHGADRDKLDEIDAAAERLTGRAPLAHAAFQWTSLRDEHDQEVHLGHIEGQRVLGVCGVGNPPSFETAVAAHAASFELESFPDHHRYTRRDLSRLFRRAADMRAQGILTTEKDWVKWRAQLESSPDLSAPVPPVPIYRVVQRAVFLDGGDALDGLLQRVAAAPKARPGDAQSATRPTQ